MKPGLIAPPSWVAPSLLTWSLLPSWPLRAPATSFVYITIKSTPWQPALDNKFSFTSAPPPNLFLPSPSISPYPQLHWHSSSSPYFLLPSSSTSPYRQEPKPEPLSFQHQPSHITRQVPLATEQACLLHVRHTTLTFTRPCAHTHAVLPSRSRSQRKTCAIHPSSSADHRGINDHQVAAPYKGGSVAVLWCPAPHSVLARCAAP